MNAKGEKVMSIKNLVFILSASVFLTGLPIMGSEPSDTVRTENTSVAGIREATDLNFVITASGRGILASETLESASPAEVPQPGFTFRPIPTLPPVLRGRFENTMFTGSLISLAALNVGDYLTTREALKYPGVGEANPFMALFVKNAWAFAAVKLAMTTYLGYSLNRLHGQNKTQAWLMSFAANALYTWVVYNNLSVIDKMRRR